MTAPKDMPPDIFRAHAFCIRHRELVLKSELCGCFYCGAIFKPEEIKDWTDEPDIGGDGVTALCAKCGIDSVIPSAAGYPITKEFLQQMNQHWF